MNITFRQDQLKPLLLFTLSILLISTLNTSCSSSDDPEPVITTNDDSGTDPDPIAPPSLTLNSVFNATENSIEFEVTINSGEGISSKGVVWSVNSNPTTSDSVQSEGSGSSGYTGLIEGLNADTEYFIRAFATNSTGTTYSNQRTISTLEASAGIYPLSLTLGSQTEIDDFGSFNYSGVDGNLRISEYASGAPKITDLSPLNSLKVVNGDLSISNTTVLTDLTGLEGLESIEELSIQFNSQLANFDALSNLTNAVIQKITISQSPGINSLEGLSSIEVCEGNFILSELDALESLIGLENLSVISGFADVRLSDGLLNLNGLENLTTVNGGLSVSNNDILTDFCAIENLVVNGDTGPGFSTRGNAYNPTEEDILNGDCAL